MHDCLLLLLHQQQQQQRTRMSGRVSWNAWTAALRQAGRHANGGVGRGKQSSTHSSTASRVYSTEPLLMTSGGWDPSPAMPLQAESRPSHAPQHALAAAAAIGEGMKEGHRALRSSNTAGWDAVET